MDVISIKVNFVIASTDGFSGEALKGSVYAKTSEGKYAMKKDGCFVFFGFASGKYTITVGGENYIEQTLELETTDECQNVRITLMPSRKYRFNGNVTKLYGKFENIGGKAEVVFPLENSEARIIGEYKKGESKINAYLPETLLRTDPKLCIAGAAYRLRHLAAAEYELSRPLDSGISADSEIGVMYEISPKQNGEYFLAVRGSFKTAVVSFNGDRKTIELNGSENEYNF